MTPATCRRTLQLLGAGAVAGVAGCLAADDTDGVATEEDGDDMDGETDGSNSDSGSETIHEIDVGSPVDTIRYVPDQPRE